MEGVREHYERLLAQHYTWMFGKPFDEKVGEEKAHLVDALQPLEICGDTRIAVDLGSGPGYQSVALAQLGFSPVIAIDTSPALLHELRAHAGENAIQAVEDDILNVGQHVAAESASVAVCMGDTITHLENREAVLVLLRSVFKTLRPGGVFVVTYRDLSRELYGVDRFIPVQSDDDRVMTCFLEFNERETVMVHDLVYTRQGTGWQLEKSCYRKLRLSTGWLESAMADAGFDVSCGSAGRLVRMVGRKP